jgi:hypothetical protein
VDDELKYYSRFEALKNNLVNCFSEWARMQAWDISRKADRQEVSRGNSSYRKRAKPEKKTRQVVHGYIQTIGCKQTLIFCVLVFIHL